MSKRKTSIIKVKVRANEAILNIRSKNYSPIVNNALIVGIAAQCVAIARNIKNNSMRNA